MKTKQLTNILLKILGVYLIVEVAANSAIVISSTVSLISVNHPDLSLPIGYGVSALLQIILAFLLVTKSQTVTGLLFKGEDE